MVATLKDPIEMLGENRAGDVVSYTVADGTNIPINSVLKLTSPRTASISTGTGDIYLGTANSEKVASDGETNLGARTNTIENFTASGSITAGDTVITAAPSNGYVMTSNSIATNPEGKKVGIALSTVSDTEPIDVRVIK